MDKNSLHRDTALTGVPKSADRAALCGKLEIGIGLYDNTCVPTEFQDHLLFPAPSLQHPSHSSAACKAQKFEAGVDDKLFCDRIVARQNVECTWRNSSL